MKDLKLFSILLFILCLVIHYSNLDGLKLNQIGQTFSDPASETDESGKEKAIVKRVIDGDTIEVEFYKNQKSYTETVRLALIDAPESVKPNTPVQPYGKDASEFLKKTLIIDTVVKIEKMKQERDKYNRLIAYVWYNGVLVNKMLVSEGLARVAYVYDPNAKYLDELKKVQQQAKAQKKGIWSISGYVTENGYNVN